MKPRSVLTAIAGTFVCIAAFLLSSGCENSSDEQEGIANMHGTWHGVAGNPAEEVTLRLQTFQEGGECGRSSNSYQFQADLHWQNGAVWTAQSEMTMKCGNEMQLLFIAPLPPPDHGIPAANWKLTWDGADGLEGSGMVITNGWGFNWDQPPGPTYRVALTR